MTWLESLFFGLISGLSEFLPISQLAHQQILQHLFGASDQPLLKLMINIALLLALLSAYAPAFQKLHREQQKLNSRNYRRHLQDSKQAFDLRMLKTAVIPLLTGMLLLLFILPSSIGLPVISLVLIANGILLYVPEHMRHGNKNARLTSRLDSIIIGFAGALCVLPGISRIGACTSAAVARGVDKENALNWALLLSLPAIVVMIGTNLLGIVAYGLESISFITILCYILASAAAYTGAYLSILLMRFLTVRIGYSGFAYYCWGAALFTFILYLI